MVVPWALSNVIGGTPRAFPPYVESARYAAEYRNYWWQHLRKTQSDTEIDSPDAVSPYPRKSDLIADRPRTDGGGSFGRFARTGLMDEFVTGALGHTLSGIEARYWLSFFKAFQDQTEAGAIAQALDRLSNEVRADAADEDLRQRTETLVETLRGLLSED